MPVEPNHVYVIPQRGHDHLTANIAANTAYGESKAITCCRSFLCDRFAEDQRSNGIGVILSGTASDGRWGCSDQGRGGHYLRPG